MPGPAGSVSDIIASAEREDKSSPVVDGGRGIGENLRETGLGVSERIAELVSACLGGDESAFETLYAEHAPRVAAYLLRSGFATADVQDLTQETFVRVFKSLRTFNSRRGSFRIWLSMIARNVARRYWSRRKQADSFDPELVDDVFAAPVETDQSPEVLEEIQAVRDCADMLPDELSRIVHLRYVEGRTTRGIAAAMDMPEATVRLRLEQAREEIAECLRKKGILD